MNHGEVQGYRIKSSMGMIPLIISAEMVSEKFDFLP